MEGKTISLGQLSDNGNAVLSLENVELAGETETSLGDGTAGNTDNIFKVFPLRSKGLILHTKSI